MAYDDERIQAAVERFVRASVRRTTDINGVRNINMEWDDIREQATSAFVLNRNAPYYVVLLGLDRLHEQATALEAKITTLEAMVVSTGKKDVPLRDLSSLQEAKQALLNLEAALNTRSSEMVGATKLPAYQQWSSSSLRYLDQVGVNVKQAGQWVQTAAAAKEGLLPLYQEVMAGYVELERVAGGLQAAMGDFQNLQLPVTAMQTVVSQARAVLTEDQTELSALSEEGRLALVEEKTLNVIAARTLVDTYLNTQRGATRLELTGTMRAYAAESYPATPATLQGDLAGPYPVMSYPVAKGAAADSRDNNVLELTSGSTHETLTLPTAFIAFLVGNGRPQPNDNEAQGITGTFTFYGKGVDLGLDAAYVEARRVALGFTDLSGAASPKGARYTENFDPAKPDIWFQPEPNDTLIVEQTVEGGTTTRYTIPLIDKSATGDTPTTYQYPTFTPGQPSSLPCQDWTGYKVQLTRDQVVERINKVLAAQDSYLYATKSAGGGIEIGGKDPLACIKVHVVGVRTPSVLVAGVETNTACQTPLGYVLDLSMEGKRLPCDTIADYVSANSTLVEATAVPKARTAAYQNLAGWTVPGNPALVNLAKFTGYGVVTSSGSHLTVQLEVYTSTFLQVGVAVGDLVSLPTQYVKSGTTFVPMSDAGACYRVDTLSATTLTASHVSGPVAETYRGRLLDVGRADVSTQVEVYDMVQGATAPNEGVYEITARDPSSIFRFELGSALSQTKAAKGANSLQLVMTVGPATLLLTAVDTLTSASLQVGGSARPLFYSNPQTAQGKTRYLKLPTAAHKVLVGDELTFYEQGRSYTRAVTAVHDGILTLDLEVTLGSAWVAGTTVLPYVVVRSGGALQTLNSALALSNWSNQSPSNVDAYSLNTGAMLNRLVQSPTSANVTESSTALQQLKAKVVSLGALSKVQLTSPLPNTTPTAFYVEPVPAVDELLATLRAKGCDRAIDVLLEGRFTEFFTMSLQQMSYSGYLKWAAAEVMREDLPVSTQGASVMQRKILSCVEDSDPDYDHSDSEGALGMPDASPLGADLPSAPDLS